MDNEVLLSLRDDDNLESFEDTLVSLIKAQILNIYGDLSGDPETEQNHFEDYVKKIYLTSNITDIIENFEIYCSDSGREDTYDYLVSQLISVFKETMGILIDIDREIVNFSDLYDIYIVFVLSLKNTIINSTKGFLYLNAHNDFKNPKNEDIVEYLLSDEFSPDDDFLKNAVITDNLAIINLNSFIIDNIISFDYNIFMKFITDFVNKNFYLKETNG